jgi:hypothetical protein
MRALGLSACTAACGLCRAGHLHRCFAGGSFRTATQRCGTWPDVATNMPTHNQTHTLNPEHVTGMCCCITGSAMPSEPMSGREVTTPDQGAASSSGKGSDSGGGSNLQPWKTALAVILPVLLMSFLAYKVGGHRECTAASCMYRQAPILQLCRQRHTHMYTPAAAKIAAVALRNRAEIAVTASAVSAHPCRRGVSQVVHVYSRKMSRLPELIRQQRKRALGQPRTGRMSLVMTDIQGFTKLMQGDADQTTQVRAKAPRRVGRINSMSFATNLQSAHALDQFSNQHRAKVAGCVTNQTAELASVSRMSAPAKRCGVHTHRSVGQARWCAHVVPLC